MGIVAVPLWIPDVPSWVAWTNGSAAIVKGAANNSPPLRVIERDGVCGGAVGAHHR